jgi:hypothetical protein
MESEDDHGPATSQLTPLQVDLVNPPNANDKWNTLTGKNVAGSVKLVELDNISDYWPVPNSKAIHIIVELPCGKRWVQWVSEILLTALLSVCHFTTSPIPPPSSPITCWSSVVSLTTSLSFIATYNAFFLL